MLSSDAGILGRGPIRYENPISLTPESENVADAVATDARKIRENTVRVHLRHRYMVYKVRMQAQSGIYMYKIFTRRLGKWLK